MQNKEICYGWLVFCKKNFDLRLEMMFTICSNMMTKKGVP